MSRTDTGPGIGTTRPHRGYTIALTLHGFQVTKDGQHVMWCLDFDDGERKIGLLLVSMQNTTQGEPCPQTTT